MIKFKGIDTEVALKEAQAKIPALQRLGRDYVVDDINVYVPELEGILQRSAKQNIVNTDNGFIIRWATPYAEKQYYTHPSDGRGKNPLATKEWTVVATEKFLPRWKAKLQ